MLLQYFDSLLALQPDSVITLKSVPVVDENGELLHTQYTLTVRVEPRLPQLPDQQ